MIVGVPKEIKTEEYRVGAPPMAVRVLTQAGHKVLVQATAGDRRRVCQGWSYYSENG